MGSDLGKAELDTTHFLHAFMGDVLRLLSEHFQGHTTLNDLRIGNYIGLRSLYEGVPTNNTGISKELGIPRSTVSRIVNDFIEQQWVIESPHPEDGRRRQLEIVPGHPLADSYERDFRVLINELLRRFDAKEVVMVDPKKKSF